MVVESGAEMNQEQVEPNVAESGEVNFWWRPVDGRRPQSRLARRHTIGAAALILTVLSGWRCCGRRNK